MTVGVQKTGTTIAAVALATHQHRLHESGGEMHDLMFKWLI